MSDATLDDRGRLTLPKELRERYGDHYHVGELLPERGERVRRDGNQLDSVVEFDDVEKSADELRDAALNEAGR